MFLTESGHEKAERLLAEWGLIGEGESLYAPQNITLMHHVYAALRAHTLFHRISTTSCRTAKWSSSTNSRAA